MLVKKIIDALREWVKHFRFGTRSSTPSSSRRQSTQKHSPTKTPSPKIETAKQDDTKLDPPPSLANSTQDKISDHLAESPEKQISDEQSSESPTAPIHDVSSPSEDNQYPTNSKPLTESAETHGEHEEPIATTREPRNIPGKRVKQPERSSSQLRQPPISHPELICRENTNRGWDVVLVADGDCLLETVEFEDRSLNLVNQECLIPSLTGHLIVSCQDGQEHSIPLSNGEPLIFKLGKDWTGVGRRVSCITKGNFIIIAPDKWKWEGRVPVEPTSCMDATFKVHYVHRDTSNEEIGGFKEYSISSNTLGIELTGQNIFDDSDKGELFVGDAPILQPSPDIIWARVGEEARRGWGENFEPSKKSLSEVLNGKDGYFFLRVYDSQEKMIDSKEFRYLHNLKQIQINDAEYTRDTVLWPNQSGYPETMKVRFVGTDDAIITPTITSNTTSVEVESGVLSIPPHPDADDISCTLGSNGDVSVVLRLPRIWWRMEDNHTDTSLWQDKPLVMTRQEFKEYARNGARMSVLLKRELGIKVGFGDELDQSCSRTINEDYISIPLNRFIDYTQIAQELNNDAYFNIKWAERAISLIQISADLEPEIDTLPFTVPKPNTPMRIYKKIKSNEYMRISKGKKVPVSVKYALWGWKQNGKGFSSRELEEAGLTIREAKNKCIPIDRRRRSSHSINIKVIKEILDA